ncbi:Asp23/Gls24 family envelope stress response protein [Streptomyces sp. 4R-3d]|uniref:Asp23/Gls24 family envelope stress response protein n=1 Tax=Streptomyces sp. 4R-3d TaxID=2559605 RepID=UPI0010720952|nr:Asp23/Gls24 family envelope stress response protein [Streptomyces sp. 4R-3d]TFI24989.1 Asp23/Gls24 family envelope stress response protein [Streptomyces sp. 4R-3d]
MAERGSTAISDRAVTKVAAQAAREALKTVPLGAAAPSAQVKVRRGAAHVRVDVELPYPCDIGARCGAVRRQVAAQVTALTGLGVPEVKVRVERLHPETTSAAHGRAR